MNRLLRHGVATVAFALSASAPVPTQLQADARIQKLVESVSEDRLRALNEKLSSFHTRNTFSDTVDQGIAAARQWIRDEMQRSSPRLQVSFDPHEIAQGGRVIRDVELQNVMAVLPGRSPRRIYVSGHYDTVSGASRPENRSPGANDDGSGTVLTMELARVFAESGLEFDATLVFICFAGEEYGLLGARAHAEKAAKESVVIDAVLNNDITGNSRGGDGTLDSASVRVFSAGPEDSPSRQLARYIQRVAAVYVPGHLVRLIARHDRFGRGGDHTAFNDNGFTAVRISESKENYTRQHNENDLSDGVDFAYLAKNAKVNAAAAASLALAPAAPRVSGGAGAGRGGRGAGDAAAAATAQTLAQGRGAGAGGAGAQPAGGRAGLSRGAGYDAMLRWIASPGAVGYRIFWRQAWTPDWEREITVGNVTEHLLPRISIDDHVFGVAAIGPGGQESLVAAYVR